MRLPSSYALLTKFTGFQLYIAYLALKNHFTKDSYDFHKYQGKVGASASAFDNRRDRYAFSKLERHRDPFGMLFSNLLCNPDAWIGEITSGGQADQIYLEWKKRQESLSYCFKEELKIIGNIDDALFVPTNSQPELLRKLNRDEVTIESVCLLQSCYNFIPYWDEQMDKVMWGDARRKIVKYLPFLEFDRDKIKEILAVHDEETA